MDHADVTKRFVNDLVSIQGDVVNILYKIPFSRVVENGKVFTSLIPTLGQSTDIQLIVERYNSATAYFSATVLNDNLQKKYEFNMITHSIDSYLKFSRVSGDFYEDTWKKLFEQEFINIVSAIIDFSNGLLDSQELCFRTNNVCPYSHISNREGLIFVLHPLQETNSDIYRLGIKEPLEENGYNVIDSDEIESLGDIVCNGVCKPIKTADFILAEVSVLNANVMLELGMAFGLNKKVILLANKTDSLPFNLRNMKIIIHRGKIDIIRKRLLNIFPKH
jgi:hypothetical protein